MKFVINGAPSTKKNSQQIWRTKGGRPFIVQSNAAKNWEEIAILQLRAVQRRMESLPGPVNLSAIFYRAKDVGDLGNFLSAVCDALERAGVVENDRLIRGFDGSRLRVDRLRPRVEIELTPLSDTDA